MAQSPILVIIAGRPCSGKSSLATSCATAIGATRFEMDEIRARILPGSQHSQADRDQAYHVMHGMAEAELKAGRSVLIDATYTRVKQRCAVVDLAELHSVPIHLVECREDPDEAAARFRGRGPEHAAIDLTESGVRQQAREYRFSALGLSLDTTGRKRSDLVADVVGHVSAGLPLDRPRDWAS
jgi:predicted kinase